MMGHYEGSKTRFSRSVLCHRPSPHARISKEISEIFDMSKPNKSMITLTNQDIQTEPSD